MKQIWSRLGATFWKPVYILATVLIVCLMLQRSAERNTPQALADAGVSQTVAMSASTTETSTPQPATPMPATPTASRTATSTRTPRAATPSASPTPVNQDLIIGALITVKDMPNGWYTLASGLPSPPIDPPLYCGTTPSRTLAALTKDMVGYAATSFQSAPTGPYFGQRLRLYSPGKVDAAWTESIAALRRCRSFTTSASCIPQPGNPVVTSAPQWRMNELSLHIDSAPDAVSFRIGTDSICNRGHAVIDLVLIKRGNVIEELYHLNAGTNIYYKPDTTLSSDTTIDLVTAADAKLMRTLLR